MWNDVTRCELMWNVLHLQKLSSFFCIVFASSLHRLCIVFASFAPCSWQLVPFVRQRSSEGAVKIWWTAHEHRSWIQTNPDESRRSKQPSEKWWNMKCVISGAARKRGRDRSDKNHRSQGPNTPNIFSRSGCIKFPQTSSPCIDATMPLASKCSTELFNNTHTYIYTYTYIYIIYIYICYT